MKVVAIKDNYFGEVRRRKGDVFSIPDYPRRDVDPKEKAKFPEVCKDVMDKKGQVPAVFTFLGMRKAEKGSPEKLSSAADGVNRRTQDLRKQIENDPEGISLNAGDSDPGSDI